MLLDKKIILAGGAGLVGQNLVAHLKIQGYKNLVVLDKHRANLKILQQLHPDITAVYADLAEKGEWEKHFEQADTVIMLQAQIGSLTLEPFVRNNIYSTQNVIAAMQYYQVPYVIHISSSVVESVANDFYTDTKKEQENLVLNCGINNIVLRPTLMFGWFDRKHLGWLSRFMKKVPIFPIPNDGRYMRQPLYVGDFCKIIISCVENKFSQQVYNISGLEKIYYIDMIREMKKAIGAHAVLVKIPYSLFALLLKTWSIVDKNPPFTVDQLKALVAPDEFEVIDWPKIFSVTPTAWSTAIHDTFNHPTYSKWVLEF